MNAFLKRGFILLLVLAMVFEQGTNLIFAASVDDGTTSGMSSAEPQEAVQTTEESVPETEADEEPAVDEPAADKEPANEEPADEQPAAEEIPAEEAAGDEPVADETPATEETVVEDPEVTEPAAEETAVEEPVTDVLDLENPVPVDPTANVPTDVPPATPEPMPPTVEIVCTCGATDAIHDPTCPLYAEPDLIAPPLDLKPVLPAAIGADDEYAIWKIDPSGNGPHKYSFDSIWVKAATRETINYGDTVYYELQGETFTGGVSSAVTYGPVEKYEAVNGIRINQTWNAGEDWVSKVEIIKKKYETSGIYQYFLAITFKEDNTRTSATNVIGEIVIKDSTGANKINRNNDTGGSTGETNKLAVNIELKYPAPAAGNLTAYTGVVTQDSRLFDFGAGYKEFELLFSNWGAAFFIVNTIGQGDLVLKADANYNTTVGALYPQANLDFFNGNGVTFKNIGEMFIPAVVGSFIYELKNGVPAAIPGVEYDMIDEGFYFQTQTLGTYIISDAALVPAVTVYNGIDYAFVYDFDEYIARYPGIAAAYGATNYEGVLAHFVNYGIPAGLQGKNSFNPYFYRNNYYGLWSGYGSDISGYYYHFIQYGDDAGLRGDVNTLFQPIYDGVDYTHVFDITYYSDNNLDLKNYFGTDYYQIFMHFLNHGMTEGRRGNNEFNVSFYRSNYPGIAQAYGDDLRSCYYHYLQYGVASNLIADEYLPIHNGTDYSAVFDFAYYKNTYPGVPAAYGADNYAGILDHFVNYGMPAGLQGRADFNPFYYRNNYYGLWTPYGSDISGYYHHYMQYGKAANLNGATNTGFVPIYENVDYDHVFDIAYYSDNNLDLKNYFGTDYYQIFMHFLQHGMTEGRQADTEFNVFTYRANYPGLVTAYGDDLRSCFYHYLQYGQPAGLNAATLI